MYIIIYVYNVYIYIYIYHQQWENSRLEIFRERPTFFPLPSLPPIPANIHPRWCVAVDRGIERIPSSWRSRLSTMFVPPARGPARETTYLLGKLAISGEDDGGKCWPPRWTMVNWSYIRALKVRIFIVDKHTENMKGKRRDSLRTLLFRQLQTNTDDEPLGRWLWEESVSDQITRFAFVPAATLM